MCHKMGLGKIDENGQDASLVPPSEMEMYNQRTTEMDMDKESGHHYYCSIKIKCKLNSDINFYHKSFV